MVKKNMKDKQMKTRNEKQVSLRLHGSDLSRYQVLNVKPIDVFRSGLYDESRKKKSSEEIKLLSKIYSVQNNITEYKLKIEANVLLLKSLEKELSELRRVSVSDINRLMLYMESRLEEYLNDDRYVGAHDLSSFYRHCRDGIIINANSVGVSYDYAIELFDEYYREKYDCDVVGDGLVVGFGDW